MTIEVGEERMKITVDVAVGVGVSVLRVGVIIGVGVEDGMAAAVWVAAALAVCAIKVFTAPGSSEGIDGVASAGTHAMINARVMTQINNFVLRVAAIISSSTSERNQVTDLCYFSTMIATYG
jgi:hypothetical protein